MVQLLMQCRKTCTLWCREGLLEVHEIGRQPWVASIAAGMMMLEEVSVHEYLFEEFSCWAQEGCSLLVSLTCLMRSWSSHCVGGHAWASGPASFPGWPVAPATSRSMDGSGRVD